MVATVSVRYDFDGVDTAPGTNQDIDALGPPRLKFKLADNATIDEANKIVIPGAGLGPYYSYWKHIYLYLDALGGSASISNVKFYNDSGNSYATGVTLYVSNVLARNSGSTATYELANTDATMVANHTGVVAATNVTTYTSASPLAVTISEGGALMDAAGHTSGYIVMQLAVANTASVQTTSSWNWYFSYDEA